MEFDYVVMVNWERKGDIDFLLASLPKAITMHWDNKAKRSRVCVGKDACKWCQKEKPSRVTYYSSCVLYEHDQDQKVIRPGLVMFPLGFVLGRNHFLVPGRWIRVINWKVDGKISYWTTGKIDDRELPESSQFDILTALMRITGQADQQVETEEHNPDVLKFRKKA
jgi:hypothetical protein